MTPNKLSFFLPFEFDQIPREWYPWDDVWEEKKGRLFIYECFKNVPFDGLLISKSKFDTNQRSLPLKHCPALRVRRG